MPKPIFAVPDWNGREGIIIDAPPAVGWRIAHALFRQFEGCQFARHQNPQAGTKRWWRKQRVFSSLEELLGYAERVATERIVVGEWLSQLILYVEDCFLSPADRERTERLIRVGPTLGIAVVWLTQPYPVGRYEGYPVYVYRSDR